jgi:2,5-diketo-D-gluconate reductase A
MNAIPDLTLNDGQRIPQLGYGTFQVPPEETAAAVRAALEAGYRHIDTAQMYHNERGVGEGVRESGLAREDVFITTKLNTGAHLPDGARRAFAGSLEALGTEYVDLFLIHWPMVLSYGGDFVSTWRVLEGLRADGRARSIGVSNFRIVDLQRLLDETEIVPAVNQIEVNPYFSNDPLRSFGREHGIITEAWSPLAQGAALSEPAVLQVAARRERTAAQVIMRWHIERGDIVFPKTMSPARMRENLAVFDFALEADDLAALATIDRGPGGRTGADPDTFDYKPG